MMSTSVCMSVCRSFVVRTANICLRTRDEWLHVHSDSWLATWHAPHQGKAKETILERREYGTIRCKVFC